MVTKNFFSSVSEVECEVSSQVEYSLQAMWGVSIRELHLALWKPWSNLREASLNGTLLQSHAQYLTPPQTYPFDIYRMVDPNANKRVAFSWKQLVSLLEGDNFRPGTAGLRRAGGD
ncbi:hypothetical protein HZH66_010508 [Vespula vulgaris]|uniref:Uncharacterized protein n=1 Tax=Vespula vulgaris TaxID=7454 RepID=A0A834JPZ8_VESVU|nr:hypothetical protein HZH66_010508 [Vespula vulgaris]